MNITELQQSALIESGNIGSGHAAIALSQLMGHKIMIAVPLVDFIDWKNADIMPNHNGGEYVFVNMNVLGDIRGAMVFAVEEATANKLCDVVMGAGAGTTKFLGEVERSAIKEIGSILSISYLNAVGDMSSLSLIGSVPELDIGKLNILRNIVKVKEVDIKEVAEVICIKTEFLESSNKIDAYLFFITSERYMGRLIKALGV